MLKQIPVSELSPGMMVTQVIEQSGVVKVRKVGFIRSLEMVRGLKEMGVTLVEVDLSQSLGVDVDEPESQKDVSPNETSNATTATQRLVNSNKQVSDVDRQLSQQFYRSSFMPAVDQMPSKWTIYGRPYAILIALVVAGIIIGSVSSYTLLAVTNNSNLSVVKLIEDSANYFPFSTQESSSIDQAENEETDQDTSLEQSPVEQMSNAQNTAAAKEQATVLANDNLTSGPSEITKVKSTDSAKENKPPIQRELVNGVLLEAGQKVLGYQGPKDEVTQTQAPQSTNTNSAGSSQSNSSKESFNSELYRRIQRVAKDVDDQPTEPKSEVLKVTNLNDLPRIDQLSPALLTQIPAMSFSAHMYASNPQDRWVRVNSRRLGEGEIIDNNVMLKRIEAEKVVLEYKGTEFTMNALSDW